MSETRDDSAGDLARKLLGRLDTGGHMERARAVAAWKDIAGDEVSQHAMGFALRGGEMVVFTDSPVWASELSALSEQYRIAVNERIGKELVGSMRFTVSREVGRERAWEDGQRLDKESYDADRTAPVALGDAERRRIEDMAQAIHTDRLRAAATRAATADMEWKKGLLARKERPPARKPPEGPQKGVDH